MVTSNPFKEKDESDSPNLNLNKIITEEKTHNHGVKPQKSSSDVKLDDMEGSLDISNILKPQDTEKDESITSNTSNTSQNKDENTPYIEMAVNEHDQDYVDSFGHFEPIEPNETESTEIADQNMTSQPRTPKLDNFDNTTYVAGPATPLRVTPQPTIIEKGDSTPEPLDTSNDSTDTNDILLPIKQEKSWLWRHRWLFIVPLLLAIAVMACFVADRNLNRVEFAISSSGLEKVLEENKDNTELPVRVLAYAANINSNYELLYYIDTTAIITSENSVKIAWDIPRDYANSRDTYNEFCVLDESKADAEVNQYCGGYSSDSTSKIFAPSSATDATHSLSLSSMAEFNSISCVYHVPARTNGLISFLSGWNQLGESQKVGCVGKAQKNGTSFGDESNMKLLIEAKDANSQGVSSSTSNSTNSSNSTNLSNDNNSNSLNLPSTGHTFGR